MEFGNINFPALTQRDISPGARLYGDRLAMIAAMAPRGGTISEVGVAMGDLSEYLLRTLTPKKFYALDLYTMHESSSIWGRSAEEWFGGKTQLEFFQDRFAAHGDVVEIRVGPSAHLLAEFDDGFFDFIYVDAGHDYEDVSADATVSAEKLAPGGLLVFNDYVLVDCFTGRDYGVVQAVNELVAGGDWKVAGFAFQHAMFCDIAVTRAS